MAKGTDRTAQFLAAMTKAGPEGEGSPEAAQPTSAQLAPDTASVTPRRPKTADKEKVSSRAGLKHFGGYLDDTTLEKIALLRIRLKMDNSQLIVHAVDELYLKHNAKRAFGDA